MLYKKTLYELTELVKNKETTPKEVYDSVLERIHKKEDEINAYVTVFERYDENKNGGFFEGLPIAIKDNMHINGKPTTCSSKILSNFTAVFDATAVKKLRENGATFIGKTNLDEFAMGSSTETSFYGVTKNPWDTTRVPGGSSGGSAAAVASG